MYVIDQRVTATVARLAKRYPMTQHPLITGLVRRRFSVEQNQLIAERFYHVIKHFPRFLAAAIANWDDTHARMPLVENLFEEHGRMNEKHIHVTTYVEYLRQMGIDVERVLRSRPSPACSAYIRSVLNICGNGNRLEGLAALAYVEDIVHQVSREIGQATKRERSDIQDVSHFSEHEFLDEHHSQEIYHMLTMASTADEEAVDYGLTMGAFYHYSLYNGILEEVLYETKASSMAHYDIETQKNKKHLEGQSSYPLQTGDEGAKRLAILNRLYNEKSISFILKNAPGSTQRFLEIGCGEGSLSWQLSKEQPQWKIVASDNSAAQIALASSKHKGERLSYVCADAEALLCREERYDVIYMRWVLIYQKNLEMMLSAMAQLLAPGGVIIIEDNEPGQSGCFSLSHSETIERWNSFWVAAVSYVGQGPGFFQRISDWFSSPSLALKDSAIQQQLLESQEEKELFFLGLMEGRDRIIAEGYPQETIDILIQEMYELRDSSSPLGFVRNCMLAFHAPA